MSVNVFSYPGQLTGLQSYGSYNLPSDMILVENAISSKEKELSELIASRDYLARLQKPTVKDAPPPQQNQQQQMPQLVAGVNCYAFGDIESWVEFFEYCDKIQMTAQEFNEEFVLFYQMKMEDRERAVEAKKQGYREKIATKNSKEPQQVQGALL